MAIAFWGCFILCFEVNAKHCGVQGSVYDIKEQDALQWIERRLKAMEVNGEIGYQQETLKRQALFSIERPVAVKNLKPTKRSRTVERDLTFSLPFDIRSASGEIIQKAGFKLNPLALVETKKSLIFLDGDDDKQLQWALRQYKSEYGLVKLVLVNGSPLALMQQYEIPFYFDQAGRLSQYFKLEQVPATVSQKKDKLVINEIKL